MKIALNTGSKLIIEDILDKVFAIVTGSGFKKYFHPQTLNGSKIRITGGNYNSNEVR